RRRDGGWPAGRPRNEGGRKAAAASKKRLPPAVHRQTCLRLRHSDASTAAGAPPVVRRLIAIWGAVAIDLPGLGQSKAAPAPAPVGQPAPGVFLRQVCEALQTGPVVIISPSLSGMYLLPFLFQHSEQVKAYIPVAPICTEKFTAEQYSSAQTPALIVYGDQDTQLGEVSLSNLKNLPNHKVVVMKGAGHPCYLDDPEIWHKAVLDFLQQL
uniref:Abhydrolase domain containing 14B n=1 Tax=Cyprinus carpio carpio TaxID=630221 RepID=A0A9J8CMD9_CYPCA